MKVHLRTSCVARTLAANNVSFAILFNTVMVCSSIQIRIRREIFLSRAQIEFSSVEIFRKDASRNSFVCSYVYRYADIRDIRDETGKEHNSVFRIGVVPNDKPYLRLHFSKLEDSCNGPFYKIASLSKEID